VGWGGVGGLELVGWLAGHRDAAQGRQLEHRGTLPPTLQRAVMRKQARTPAMPMGRPAPK
jgi:hypothetical protein